MTGRVRRLAVLFVFVIPGAVVALSPGGARAAARPAPAKKAAVVPFAGLKNEIVMAEDRRDWSGGRIAGALQHKDAEVRARAVLAAGRLQDTTSIPALLPLLRDKVPNVRREAVFALGQIGNRAARAPLEGLLADKDPEIVALACEALGKLGDPQAAARLVPVLRRGTPAQKMRVCESLWRLADTSATSALLAALNDRDPAVRWRVLWALEKLPVPARIVPAVLPLLRDADPLVRAHAARTIGREKSPLGTQALAAALEDDDPAVIVNAVRAIQQIADTTAEATGTSLTRLLMHRDPYVRVTAATALADSFVWAMPSADVEALRAALRLGVSDGDAATRGACGRSLLARQYLAALEWVRPLYSDPSPYARVAAVDGLRNMRAREVGGKPPRVVNAIAAAFHQDPDLLVRMTAADVAGVLIGRTHHEAFAPLLDSLRAGVDDRRILLAAACAGALADAGDSASIPRLAAAYAARGLDADSDARISIRDALRALAGRAFADSIEKAHPTPAPEEKYNDAFFAAPDVRRAILKTSAGVMEWEFYGAQAPQTVKNFVSLARKNYFDSTRVHRVVPDFVIQDGDPTGTGSGGPGYAIRCEYNQLRYETGMVGMALSGKDTGGSQWFVTLSPQPHLNGRYTIFARVTRGLDVAKRVTQGAIVYGVEVLP